MTGIAALLSQWLPPHSSLSLPRLRRAPTDASEDEFCGVFNDSAIAGGEIADDDFEAQADALNDYADKLDEVGTPEDIPDDARKGFEVVVEVFGEISADDSRTRTQQALEEKYKDDEKDVTAFFGYAGETCQPAVPDIGTPEAPEES